MKDLQLIIQHNKSLK